MATCENADHGVLCQTVSPQGTAIYDLVNKYDLEDYLDKLAAAATTEKGVLEKLTAAIAALTINNEALVATNSKLVEEVTNFTRRLGQNTGSETSGKRRTSEVPIPVRTATNRAFTSLIPT